MSAVQKRRLAVRRARPLHKKVLLHPFTVMVLLCAGVLIVGTTIRGFAASYNVTATVPAPVPTQAAAITSPGASTHVHSAAVTVSGSCQAQSYVTVSDNGVVSGTAACDTNLVFSMPLTLTAGSNELQPHIYSLTDQPGPVGQPVTVYFDDTTLPPAIPPATPATLQLANVESSPFAPSITTWKTSDNPTISGFAPPFSHIVVTFHSAVVTCETQADATGWWSCTLDTSLPAGVHHVGVVATTQDGRTLTLPTFDITVLAARQSILQPDVSAAPHLSFDHTYQSRHSGQATVWNVNITSGVAPFVVDIAWGDGATQHLVRQDGAGFTLTHTYTSSDSNTYLITLTTTDARHAQSKVQVIAAINLSVVTAASVLKTDGSASSFNAFLAEVQQRLWLIWPAYMVVVLMAIGYYLGEREEYRRLALAKQPAMLVRRAAHRNGKMK